MAYAPFDVVVVPFPYADRLAEKRRPAVVVSTPVLEKQHGLVWLAMVTSASHRAWADDVTITDLKSGGLPAPSRLRPAKIATVDSARIVRRIGKLSTKDAAAARAKLRALLAS
jgi:mRNA-degrading endonuclease toxin of MazEF toxin-antitoxin module